MNEAAGGRNSGEPAMSRAGTTFLLVVLVFGFAIAAGGDPPIGASGFSELHRVDIADAGDLEAVMGLIERSAKSIGAKHYHPGGEFGFVLEGSVTITTENEPQATLEAGDSFYQAPREWHVVSTGPEGAKTVVFRLLEKGEPMIVAVE